MMNCFGGFFLTRSGASFKNIKPLEQASGFFHKVKQEVKATFTCKLKSI